MPLFSQRYGHKPAVKALQLDTVDEELRKSLWSTIHTMFFVVETLQGLWVADPRDKERKARMLRAFWFDYLREATDTFPGVDSSLIIAREKFYSCQWHEVYEQLEFYHEIAPNDRAQKFRDLCNRFLIKDNSGYRFIQGKIGPITSPEEIEAIESAQKIPVSEVNAHLFKSLEMLVDRKQPDYRNSMKEAISGVEAECRKIAANEKLTLADALKRIKNKAKIHPAVERAFQALYGFTSDDQGIRHAMSDMPTVTFTDAKFMLVACSAFINYLEGKKAELGL